MFEAAKPAEATMWRWELSPVSSATRVAWRMAVWGHVGGYDLRWWMLVTKVKRS